MPKMAANTIARYSDDGQFTTLLGTIGTAEREIRRLNQEGFNTLEDILSTYNDTYEL